MSDAPHVRLTWRVADVLPSGDPDPKLRDIPIEPSPSVRCAALGEPLQDTTYSPIDGSIIVPRALLQPQIDGGTPTWRLEYTLADSVPHEVQWSPEPNSGHLIVPLFGRVLRNPVPPGGGYTVTPTSASSPYKSPRMFTTGQWSEGQIPSYVGTGTTIDYDFSNAAAMSGSRARPEPTLGDRAFLIDYDSNFTRCRYAVGWAALDSAAMEPGKHSLTGAIWDVTPRATISDPVSPSSLARLRQALGQLQEGTVLSGTIALGIAASAQLPPLTGVPSSPLLPVATALPAPVMITVLQCPYDQTLVGATVPADLDSFSRMLHVQLVSSRRVLGIALTSGMETAIASSSGVDFKISFPAAIATTITLTTPTKPRIALDGADELVDIGPATGRMALDFVPETAEARPDYYDVTLHQLDADALVPRRIYTVTAPHVELDGTAFKPGALYVLEIRSFKGQPSASSGDFRAVSFPYGSAIVFTRTFRADIAP